MRGLKYQYLNLPSVAGDSAYFGGGSFQYMFVFFEKENFVFILHVLIEQQIYLVVKIVTLKYIL